MVRARVAVALTVAALGTPLASGAVWAQGQPPGTVTVNVAITGIHAFDANLDEGGDVGMSSLTLNAGVSRQFVPALAGGVSVRYGIEDWRFGSPSAFGGRAPWNRLERSAVGVNSSLALSPSVVIGISPSVEWPREVGGSAGDALIYGAVVSAAKVFSPKLVLGAGASVYRQFYDIKTSYFAIITWKITDQLRVANAFPAGPEGGAGIELRYAFTPDWEAAGGGVYRSDRYRLEAHGAAPGNVGETTSFPFFARVSRKIGSVLRVDLYGGALTNGKLDVKDSNGGVLTEDRYATAPALALSLNGRF